MTSLKNTEVEALAFEFQHSAQDVALQDCASNVLAVTFLRALLDVQDETRIWFVVSNVFAGGDLAEQGSNWSEDSECSRSHFLEIESINFGP